MSEWNISIDGGGSKRLKTAGKYCDRDIIVTAVGGSEDLNDVLNEQEALITELQEVIASKAAGGGSGGDSELTAPADGKTHIYITLQEGRLSPRLTLCPKGTVTVDWGDGSTPDVLTGTSTSSTKNTPEHTYAEPGNYEIVLDIDGELGIPTDMVNCSNRNLKTAYKMGVYDVRFSDNVTYFANMAFSQYSALKKAWLPSLAAIPQKLFSDCTMLATVNIPDGQSQISASLFYNCKSLSNISFPDGLKTIGNEVMRSCSALKNFSLPDSLTTIGSSAFEYCYSLTKVIFPAGFASLGGSAFSGCYIKTYDFTKCLAVPALTGGSAFYNTVNDFEIRVPAALYDEWIAATNWSSYASDIVAV